MLIGVPGCVLLAVMSANEQKDTVFQAIAQGAEEYLVKPVTKKEVQNIWQYVWKRWSASQLSRPSSQVRHTCSVWIILHGKYLDLSAGASTGFDAYVPSTGKFDILQVSTAAAVFTLVDVRAG
jgi:CheY-like chemotaxis protein